MDNKSNIFFKNFKQMVVARGLTIDNVMSEVLGKTSHAFQGWQQRGLTPRGEELCKLAEFFEVPIDAFFRETFEVMPPRYKGVIKVLDELNDEEVEKLEKMSVEKLKALIKLS